MNRRTLRPVDGTAQSAIQGESVPEVRPNPATDPGRGARRRLRAPDPVSPVIWRFMVAYFDRFLRRHLNAVRLARWGVPLCAEHSGPIVVYCNHPAWWDAATVILLAGRLFPTRECYAPFDAKALERYAVFRRMGAFGVDLETARGAAQFLAASRGILSRPHRMIWITAQGRFVDVRARPLGLRPGVARLAEIAPNALFLPLALEYAFWEERGAEACAAFGTPIPAADLLALPRPERLGRLEGALTATLDRLSADVIAREPARFAPLVSGAKGIGGIYDGWRRLKALRAGRRFDPAHHSARDAESEAP